MLQLPRLYPILDAACFPDASAMFVAAEELSAAGITLLQYRNKQGTARQMLDQARELRARLGASVKLLMNDRADLCVAAGFDGLHVGHAGWEYQRTIPSSLRKPTRLPPTTWPSALSSRPAVRPIPILSWDSKAFGGQGN
ncbi:MAG: thiamine phosphate synthase [Terriglobales bacterium]